ncbi:aryl-alcohol dehydrogenase-like predicted oxidoreductase [Nitrobacter winogradskyi]|uniref:Aryl-alcohol dehydrogenase-like predicted oxidoreductase n=2 Tax=Nitrobacter winogradskyi TaxID=913 RepID=A0ACC6AQL6_NITWI|nr:aryl-alcohol dehydrogenase-like predicted oxidoreductase [Nitrobacter winogradskyi]GEC17665.1 hypothetical protein NWI01_35570 [Nitrobacter winogradskyi]
MPYYPLASELLTGKYRRGVEPAKKTRLGSHLSWAQALMTEQNWNRLDQLNTIGLRDRHSILELAIGWLLARPVVGSVIAGATNPEQARQNVAAAATQLSAALLSEIDAVIIPQQSSATRA